MESTLPHPSLMECLQGAAHIIAGGALNYEEGKEYDFGSLPNDKIESGWLSPLVY